ncbi:hypothetical protein BsWGS_00492 [Bradybaena similaris]
MSPASVVSCIVSKGLVNVSASVNVNYRNQALNNPKEGISNETNSYISGLLQCTFFRDTLSSDSQVFNLTEPWYLITAKGAVDANGSLTRHSRTDRYKTDARINLANVTTDYSVAVTTTPALTSSTPTLTSSFQKNPECGKARSCFSDCINNVCGWEISWKNAGDKYQIIIKSIAADNTYVSLGFSDAKTMSPASVVSCIVSKGLVNVSASVNVNYRNQALNNPKEGISNETNSYISGLLQCTFFRDTLSSDSQVFNLTEPWYLITAKGAVDANGSLTRHSRTDRYKTDARINLANVTTDYSVAVTTTPALTSSTPTLTSSFQKNPECGKARSCFSDCINNVCGWEISWKNAGDKYQIIIKSIAADNTYVSLGFSDAKTMSPASVVSCIVSKGLVNVSASVNVNYRNQALNNPKEGISNETNSYISGLLQCTFYRDTLSSDSQVFNLTEPWYLITAKGSVDANGNLTRHSRTDRYKTDARINLANVTTDYSVAVTTTPALASSTPAPTSSFQKNPECGKARGCFSDCINDVCDWEISWKNSGDKYQIIIKAFAADNTYVSLGFSDANTMNPASVVSCLVSKGLVKVSASFNADFDNQALKNPKEGISNETNSYISGLLQCTFYRDTLSSDSQVFNLTEPWYLITAKGSVDATGNLIQHSRTDRYKTDARINLANVTTDHSVAVTTTPASASSTPAPTVNQFQKDPDCGKTKGCYSNCRNNLCSLLVSWQDKGSYFEISLKYGFATPGDYYFAVGFSKEAAMGQASVQACTSYQGNVDASTSYNDDSHSNTPLQSEGLSDITGSFSDGVLSCKFNRNTSSNGNDQFFDLAQQWYIVTATGNAYQRGGLMPHASKDTSVWSSRVDFTDPTVDISLETTEYPLVKAHGCLMVITWVLAASIGLTMARFFKKLWPDNKVCGVKIWFAVHRAAMVATFVIGITAFILIFIQVKGYSEVTGPAYLKAHPVLGIMVTALLFINPFISLLRCAPDHPRREIFNWVHWLVGTSAHVLGGVTVVLGLYMPKALVDADKGLVIMIVYGSWYIIFFLVMTQLDYKSAAAPSKGDGDLNSLGQNGVSELTSVKYGLLNGINEPPLSGVKKLLTLFHFLMLICLTIALIYLIANGSF